MSFLAVKISCIDLGVTKTLQFNGSSSVSEVCKEIKERFGDKAGGLDHSLFFPAQGKWLWPSKVLEYYDIKSGDVLEFKKKHRPLKVRTLDGTVKTVIIDESLPVKQLVDVICEKMGIANPDEYSIMPELIGTEKSEAASPAKKSTDKKGGDDQRWLNPEKTIAEQGLTENDTVILKKKFFFTDQNIDRNDPVQLNLLYNQAQKAIVGGTHPCTADEAAQFGAIQLQIQYGNHEPDKHKPGFAVYVIASMETNIARIKEYLPKEYQKNKEIEKKMYAEHRKLQGLNQLNAKYRYVQLSRSLKTYGYTFFLVKEKSEKKKDKLVSILLGITRQSIVRLDAETKDVVKEWPLTQLRRWAATPNTFTLDFGDYADSYYNVQTTEGEQISQLIAGYIDIILKRRKQAEKAAQIEEENVASVEEFMKPGKATNVSVATTSGQRVAAETKIVGKPTISQNATPANLIRNVSTISPISPMEVSSALQSLLLNVRNAFAMSNNVAADIGVPLQLPPVGSDPAAMAWKQQTVDVNAENVAAQIAIALAAVGSLINNASGIPDAMNLEAIGLGISSLATNLSQMGQGVKMLCGLIDDDSVRDALLSAASELAKATSKLIDLSQPVISGDIKAKGLMHEAARDLSAEASNLLSVLGLMEVSDEGEGDFLESCNALAKAVGELIAAARGAAKATEDENLQQMVATGAKLTYETTNQLIMSTMVLYPTITARNCKDQVYEGSMLLKDAVNGLCDSCTPIDNDADLAAIDEATRKVEESLAALLELCQNTRPEGAPEPSELISHYSNMIDSLETMKEAYGKPEEIVLAARNLTLSTTQFVNCLKAKIDDYDNKDDLLNAARELAESTARMVNSAKESARAPQDTDKLDSLKNAVTTINEAIFRTTTPEIREFYIHKLARMLRDILSCTSQVTTAAKNAAIYNRNQSTQLTLNQSSRKANEVQPTIISAIKQFSTNPAHMISQVKLMRSAKAILGPGENLINAARAASSSIGDPAAQTQLVSSTNQYDDRLHDLERLIGIIEKLNAEVGINEALKTIQDIKQDLQLVKKVVGDTPNIPAEERRKTFRQTMQYERRSTIYGGKSGLASTVLEEGRFAFSGSSNPVKDLAVATSNIAKRLSQFTENSAETVTKENAADALFALQYLSLATEEYALSEDDAALRNQILDAAMNVSDRLSQLIGSSTSRQSNVASLTDDARMFLQSILRSLPGTKDVEEALGSIDATMKNLSLLDNVERDNLTGDINSAAQNLQSAMSKMVSSVNTQQDVKESVSQFKDALEALSRSAVTYADGKDDSAKNRALTGVQDLGGLSLSYLQTVKELLLNPEDDGFSDDLFSISEKIGNSVNMIVGACNVATRETPLGSAMKKLRTVDQRLDLVFDNSIEPAHCTALMSQFNDKIKTLMSSTAPVVASVGSDDHESQTETYVANLEQLSDTVSRLAFAIALADVDSVQAEKSILNLELLLKSGNQLRQKLRNVAENGIPGAEGPELASIVLELTETLKQICVDAENNPSTPKYAKSRFSQYKQGLNERGNNMAFNLKNVYDNQPETLTRAKRTAETFLNDLKEFMAFATQPDFAGKKATISPNGIVVQKNITESYRSVLKAVNNLFTNLDNPSEDGMSLQQASREVTASFQSLMKLLSSQLPGQKQCQDAIVRINAVNAAIDQAILEATVNNLTSKEIKVDKMAVVEATRALLSIIDVVGDAASTNGVVLASAVTDIPSSINLTLPECVAYASTVADNETQNEILNACKDVADGLVSFLMVAKSAGLNAANADANNKLSQQRNLAKANTQKLISLVEGASSQVPEFAKAVESIEGLVRCLDSAPRASEEVLDMADVQQKIQKLVEYVNEITLRTKNTSQARAFVGSLVEATRNVFEVGEVALSHADDTKSRESLNNALREVGSNSVWFVDAMKLSFGGGTSSADQGKARLTQTSKNLTAAAANLLAAIKETNRSDEMVDKALAVIDEVVVDLEASLVFANLGQLDSTDTKGSFISCLDQIMNSSNELTRLMAGFAEVNKDSMSTLAANSSTRIEELKASVKKAAMAITSADKNMQVQVLGICKSIAQTLHAMIEAAVKKYGGRNVDETIDLMPLVQQENTHISELLNVANVLADESTRGQRALDAAIKDVDDMIQGLIMDDSNIHGTALPDEVVAFVKKVASHSASFLASATSTKNSQEIISNTGTIKKLLEDMVWASKACVKNAPAEVKDEMTLAIKGCCLAMQNMLVKVRGSLDRGASADHIDPQQLATNIATAVGEVVAACGALVPGGYVDPNDPNVIAERELLAAANSIEAAAKKLAELAPLQKPREANEALAFDEQILEAAKAIAAATGALIRSATSVQREIVSTASNSTPGTTMYYADGTWSDGLVSAAKQVAAATHDLCEAANEAVKGNLQLERVIVASRSVSVSTTQLLTAATVRADPNSQNQARLKAAGRAVTTAAERLVKTAQETMAIKDADDISEHMIKGNSSMTGSKVAEMEAQMNILKMEKELEKARSKLANLRKDRYHSGTSKVQPSPTDRDSDGTLTPSSASTQSPIVVESNVSPSKIRMMNRSSRIFDRKDGGHRLNAARPSESGKP